MQALNIKQSDLGQMRKKHWQDSGMGLNYCWMLAKTNKLRWTGDALSLLGLYFCPLWKSNKAFDLENNDVWRWHMSHWKVEASKKQKARVNGLKTVGFIAPWNYDYFIGGSLPKESCDPILLFLLWVAADF